jgi:hypothetical protein
VHARLLTLSINIYNTSCRAPCQFGISNHTDKRSEQLRSKHSPSYTSQQSVPLLAKHFLNLYP